MVTETLFSLLHKNHIQQRKQSPPFVCHVERAHQNLLFIHKILRYRSPVYNAIPAIWQCCQHVQQAIGTMSEGESSEDHSVEKNELDQKFLTMFTTLSSDDVCAIERFFTQYQNEGYADISRREVSRFYRALIKVVHPLLLWKDGNFSGNGLIQIVKQRPLWPMLVFVGGCLLMVLVVVLWVRPHDDSGLSGTYYSDVAFSKPVIKQNDKTVDFNWKKGGPPSVKAADHFSVRWNGTVTIKAGEKKIFSVGADDSVRLFINGRLLIDNSGAHAFRTKQAKVSIGPGVHKIRVEYVEFTGAARVLLQWNTEAGYWAVVPTDRLSSVNNHR